jgi:hypothetical protein
MFDKVTTHPSHGILLFEQDSTVLRVVITSRYKTHPYFVAYTASNDASLHVRRHQDHQKAVRPVLTVFNMPTSAIFSIKPKRE